MLGAQALGNYVYISIYVSRRKKNKEKYWVKNNPVLQLVFEV